MGDIVQIICFELFQKSAIKPRENPIPKQSYHTFGYFHLPKPTLRKFLASVNKMAKIIGMGSCLTKDNYACVTSHLKDVFLPE